ncbi:MAG: hypothetical protein WC242_03165 [Candidatus Paceibacterota bacterium]|jgi:hypothetical protein
MVVKRFFFWSLRGMAVILIALYTAGSTLVIVGIFSPSQFLGTSMTISMIGWPMRRYEEIEASSSS